MARRLRNRFGQFVRGARSAIRGKTVRRQIRIAAKTAHLRYRARRASGAVRKAGSHHGGFLNFPHIGKYFRFGRTMDILTGAGQRALHVWGSTRMALIQARNDYLGVGPDGSFDLEQALPNAAGMATGLLRDHIRSRLGVYRGMSKGKILSYLMGASPEVVATIRNGVPRNQADLKQWNADRVLADRAYDVGDGQFKPATSEQFKQSIGLDIALFVAQKGAERFINPLLPPGVNL